MTPAISAGSRPLSAACCRMMSSWRRGSAISWTALSTRGATIAATTAAETTIATASQVTRRSSARRRCGVRRGRARVVADRVLMSLMQLLKYPGQRPLQLVERPGVCDRVRRSGRFLLLGELARRALVERLVPPRPGPLAPDGLVGHHCNGSVEGRVHPGLEQQRHLDHQRTRRGIARRLLLAPRPQPLADPRPQHPLEPLAVLGGGEGALGDG